MQCHRGDVGVKCCHVNRTSALRYWGVGCIYIAQSMWGIFHRILSVLHNIVRASPPLRVKGSWQTLWRGLAEKSAPPLLLGLFNLPAPLTILPGERCSCCTQIPGPHPLAISKSCHFWVEPTLQGIFLTVFQIEEPLCKVRVGECHPKKISACLEPSKHISRVCLDAQGWRCSYANGKPFTVHPL